MVEEKIGFKKTIAALVIDGIEFLPLLNSARQLRIVKIRILKEGEKEPIAFSFI